MVNKDEHKPPPGLTIICTYTGECPTS